MRLALSPLQASPAALAPLRKARATDGADVRQTIAAHGLPTLILGILGRTEARGGDTRAIDSAMRPQMCAMRLPKFSAA